MWVTIGKCRFVLYSFIEGPKKATPQLHSPFPVRSPRQNRQRGQSVPDCRRKENPFPASVFMLDNYK